MANLRNLSDKELLAELKRRKKEANKPPEPLTRPDFSAIIKLAQDMVAERAKPDYCDDNDNDHWCFEAVLTAIYGNKIWDWWNREVQFPYDVVDNNPEEELNR